MWKKGDRIVTKVNSVVIDDMRVFNPTEEQILADGWKPYTPPAPQPPTHEEITEMRKQAYTMRADPLFCAYNHYKEVGEDKEAEEMRLLWLAEIEKIKEELPYNE